MGETKRDATTEGRSATDSVVRPGSVTDAESGSPRPFMGFSLPYDPYSHKATTYRMASCARPHMRAFHLSWISFLMAFIAWFSFAPLAPAIKKTLGLSKTDILIANIASVASTVLARLVVGPVMDIIGPRLGQAAILAFCSVPTFFAGLIQNFAGLVAIRALVGIVGAAFVGCQFWCTVMFSKQIIGTMNAIAGGWGNLGGGITQVLMIGIFELNRSSPSCDDECAWRNAFYIPAFSLLAAAALVYFLGDDCPKGRYIRPSQKSPARAMGTIAVNPQVWILIAQYGACFGVELHVNNIAALYYFERFGVSLATAGLVASLFGLMNLFARAWGGMLSDHCYSRWGMEGRKRVHILLMCGEAITLILFSLQGTFEGAVIVMVFFSIFVQSAEGSTFGIVPYIDPVHTGGVCGFVGAGGNVGAVLWGVIFIYTESFAQGFFILGFIVLFVAISGMLIKAPDGNDNVKVGLKRVESVTAAGPCLSKPASHQNPRASKDAPSDGAHDPTPDSHCTV